MALKMSGFFEQLQTMTDSALNNDEPDVALIREVIGRSKEHLLAVLDAAYRVRRRWVGDTVTVHVINNAQNGKCREDCRYCAQAKTADNEIEEYAIKSDDEFLKEAEAAYQKGAHRYCMVFAGRGPSLSRVKRLADLIKNIKSRYPLEVCVSTGLIDEPKAALLKEAGLDRLNHNLNTSRDNYSKICTTHTYQDRLETLKAARKQGLQICSGMIVGMNETLDEIIEVALTLRDMQAESIPVNFFIPVPGHQLADTAALDPQFCLKILCLFRFINPKAELRIAAGREWHLRSMEVMALYPANSLFLDGYLNAKGAEWRRTLQMIQDAGFAIESELELGDILNDVGAESVSREFMKGKSELRPFME